MTARRLPVNALAVTVLAAASMLASAGSAAAFDPAREARNYSKITERQQEYLTPEYQQELRERGAREMQEGLAIRESDPERDFYENLCWSHTDGCAGDVRLYDWEANGHGIVRPVLFTARNGATISGHVWATRSGPDRRPGVVITNGSVQAPEQLYWFAATTLAKRGYVVLTFDPQGQGRSDTRGEAPDEQEGYPAQAGRPFFDGTEDALDFFFSRPGRPYRPRPSCTSGTSHAAKHDRRVRAGLNARHNPLWDMLDGERIGLAGHSFGAAGVSFVGQADPRVDAIVAWDNLATPERGPQVAPCPSAPETREVPAITKPGLGMSADYFLTPTPYTADPDPLAKSAASLAYSRAGVDTGELVTRGGTHYEYSYIPDPAFGATLRGMDSVAWYTAAWLDRHVKGDASAELRLRTGRWRDDAPEAEVDPERDGNHFSFYYRSRLDIALASGGRSGCEDLRAGCGALVANDGEPPRYSYLEEALTADGGGARRPAR